MPIRPLTALTAALALTALALPAGARPADEDEADVARTLAFEAAVTGDWAGADAACRRLAELGRGDDPRLLLLHARALEALGEDAAARGRLDALLGLEPDHAVGLYERARLAAADGEAARAKDLLLAAARAGRLVLRDLGAADAPAGMRALLDDPRFVLALMEAPRALRIEDDPARDDPFASPLRRGDAAPPPEVDPELAARLARLEAEIDALFAEVFRLAEEDAPLERLVARFSDLRRLLDRYAEHGPAAARRKLAEYRDRRTELEAVYETIRLQVLLHEGNGHLRAMHRALGDERFAAVHAGARALAETCDRLREDAEPVAARYADALALRGEQLVERARTLEHLAGLELEVTGVVLAPGDTPSTVIVDDRIYRVGDELVDAATDAPLGVRVVGIAERSVTLRYRDVELVRRLKSRS